MPRGVAALRVLQFVCAMALVIEQVTRVSFPGVKAKWEIKSDKLVEADGITFVKLACWQGSLIRLVIQGCAHAPNPLPKGFSLSASNGLRALSASRNEAQMAELQAAPEETHSLFDTPQQAKRKRVSRAEAKDMRGKPETVEITIPSFAGFSEMKINVLRPVHPRDACAPTTVRSQWASRIKCIAQRGADGRARCSSVARSHSRLWHSCNFEPGVCKTTVTISIFMEALSGLDSCIWFC